MKKDNLNKNVIKNINIEQDSLKNDEFNKDKLNKNSKRSFIFILLFSFLIFVILFGILLLYKNAKDSLKKEAIDKEFGIVCIGDSLTHGTGGDFISYPDYLREIMKDNFYYVPVYNLGIGGENTLTIAGRMGAIPFEVHSFTIPSNGRANISFLNDNQKPFRQDGNDGINPCIISEVEGNILYDNELDEYYFERITSGEKVLVNEGSKINTFANSFYRDGIFIVFIGENGGFKNYEELISQQQSILNLQNMNSEKFIVVGLCSGTSEERKELDELLSNTYGNKFLNIREILTDENLLNKYNISLTDKDKEQIAIGRIPDSLRMDDIHFSPDGYYIFADKIFEKIEELGYFNDIDSSVNNFNKRWSMLDKCIKFIRQYL